MEISEHFERTARDIEDRVRPQIEAAKKQVAGINDQIVGYIRANPGRCLLGAVAVGFIIGRIARR
jgi:hypothetical protein